MQSTQAFGTIRLSCRVPLQRYIIERPRPSQKVPLCIPVNHLLYATSHYYVYTYLFEVECGCHQPTTLNRVQPSPASRL